MENVYIIGAGARGRLAYQIFSEGGVEVQGFISSEPKGTTVEGVPVVCSIDEFVEGYLSGKVDALFLGIGDNYERFQIHNHGIRLAQNLLPSIFFYNIHLLY